ncbi:Copper chaperone CopZ [Sporobacter termitidis DSM 10068]|uniref:Copper chaperone CopZ n=1 Tax=Sporobacter termitidis DSM 10068 TaxID=1123282 RepID=A0A1M5VRQ1_9FIRM|nr:heavy-metal-associated domain-containing protein [Sporobacter termitidis]SHH77907.1 Copper chaperone CopZ [Sporobacter termitidis DSM 10068]
MKASAYFTVGDLNGKHGAKELKHALDALGGVISVSVSQKSGSVAVDYDTTGESCEKIQQKIQDLGYDVLDVRLDEHMM